PAPAPASSAPMMIIPAAPYAAFTMAEVRVACIPASEYGEGGVSSSKMSRRWRLRTTRRGARPPGDCTVYVTANQIPVPGRPASGLLQTVKVDGAENEGGMHKVRFNGWTELSQVEFSAWQGGERMGVGIDVLYEKKQMRSHTNMSSTVGAEGPPPNGIREKE
ncbi:MAG: hypothetical protein Q9217_005913, partial [Psora testacea]